MRSMISVRINNIYIRCLVGTALLLTACKAEVSDENNSQFIGTPVEISLLKDDGRVGTRALTPLTSGTAWLTGGSGGLKPYIWNNNAFTSTNPLIWTGMNMTINGYYAGLNGQTTVMSDLSYSIDYSNSAVDCGFLSGQTSASYAEQTRVAITLRQQLAKIYVMVRSDGGSIINNAKLSNIYTSGIFSSILDINGYATGGNDGTGWTVSGSTSTVSMSVIKDSNGNDTNNFQAIIIPQSVNSGMTFFSVVIDGLTAQFQLESTTTFKAGRQYNLSLDQVSQTLYLESEIQIADFGTGDTSSENNVEPR